MHRIIYYYHYFKHILFNKKHKFLDEYFSNATLFLYFAVIFGSIFLILFIFDEIITPAEHLVNLKKLTILENDKLALELNHLKELNQTQVSLLESLDDTNKKLLTQLEKEHLENVEHRKEMVDHANINYAILIAVGASVGFMLLRCFS